MSETDAGQLRRDLMLLSLVAGIEAGRSPGPITAEAGAAQLRVAAIAQAAARVLPPLVLRMELATGIPFGRVLQRSVDYAVTQLYIVKDTGQGYRILDAVEPRVSNLGSGPVSQKFRNSRTFVQSPQSFRYVRRADFIDPD